MREIYLIAIILGIMYTGLTLYFEWRLEQKQKEWQRKLKHTHNSKKN